MLGRLSWSAIPFDNSIVMGTCARVSDQKLFQTYIGFKLPAKSLPGWCQHGYP